MRFREKLAGLWQSWRKRQRTRRHRIQRPLLTEKLEPRQLLAGDLELQFQNVGLLHDTGQSDSDGMTANWTIFGTIHGQVNPAQLTVEYDIDGDLQPEGMTNATALLDESPPQFVFAFDPRLDRPELATYTGLVTIRYRARSLLADGTERVTDWHEFQFTAEPVPAASEQLRALRLKTDTGSSASDNVTWVAIVVAALDRSSGQQGGSGQEGSGSGDPSDPGGGQMTGGSGSAGSGSDGGSTGYPGGSSGYGNPSGSGGYSSSGGWSGSGTSSGGYDPTGPSGGYPSSPGGSPSGGGSSEPANYGSSGGGSSGSASRSYSGNSPYPNDMFPEFLAPEPVPLQRLAIEWDWTADGVADARSWLDDTDQAELDLSDLPYGRHTVQARILQWDPTYGAARYSDWKSLTFYYVAAPAPEIVELRLANDTGVPDDKITADTRLSGRLAAEGGFELALVYWDADGDGKADGQVLPDEQGNFEIVPRGLASGPVTVHVRSSRWDVKAQAELFGPWQSFSYTFQPQPAPKIASLEFLPADATAHLSPRLSGRLSGIEPGVVIEFDDNRDGQVDAVAVGRAEGSFERLINPSQPGTYTVAVRTRVIDGQPERWGDWQEFSYTVGTVTTVSLQIGSLALLRDTGLSDSDRISSDPRIAGMIESSTELPWKWVELDYDADGVPDVFSLADGSGRFVLYPQAGEYGEYHWLVRASGLDPNTGYIVRTGWQSFSWNYAADPLVVPQIEQIGLAVDSGQPADGRTSVPWLEGRVGRTQNRSTVLEVDVGADGTIDQVVVASADGYFLVQPTVQPGPVHVRVRAVSWQDDSGQFLAGDWRELSFIYETDPAAPAFLVNPTIAPAEHQAFPVNMVTGWVAGRQSAAAMAVELDTNGDGVVDRTQAVGSDGSFRVEVAALADEHLTVRIRTKQITPDGEEVFGQWKELRFQPQSRPDLVQVGQWQPPARIRDLRLVSDTGASDSDLATSDPRVTGRLDAPQPGGKLVEYDLDGDGQPDGVVMTDGQGRFTIDPAPAGEGLVRVGVRPLDGSGSGTWDSISFVYAAEPDGEEVQRLAEAVLRYQTSRQAAVDQYWDAVTEAAQRRHQRLQQAADQRNRQHRTDAEQLAADVAAADETFYQAVREIDSQYAADLGAAAEQLAARLASHDFDTSMVLPDLVWPDAPPDGRAPLPLVDAWAPPFALTIPLLDNQQARIPSQLTETWRRTAADTDQRWQTSETESLRGEQQAREALDASHLAAVQQARQEWLRRVRVAEEQFDERLRQRHPSIDLVLEELAYQYAVQQAENVYQAALEAHRLALEARLAPLHEILRAAITAAQQEYERRMQELSDYYANNPPSNPMEYSDFELAWRKQAFSDRETAIADAYLAFDQAVADAYRMKERQDAEALYQRDQAILVAERRLIQQQLEVAIWQQQNYHDAWKDFQAEAIRAEADLQVRLADAAQRWQIQTADLALESRLRGIERRKQRAVSLAGALRNAWPDDQLPALPELQLAHQLDRIDADYQEQLADLVARLDADAAQAVHQWQQDVANADHRRTLLIEQARAVRDRNLLKIESDRRQVRIDAVADEIRQRLAEQFVYRGQLVDLRRTRDLEVADENHRFAMDRAQIDYDYLLERRDIYLDYMGQMRDTPIDVPLAEAARRQAHRLARAENRHRHERLNIDESWSDGTLAALLTYRLQLHHWADQRTRIFVQNEYAASNASVQQESLFTETMAMGDIQHWESLQLADRTLGGVLGDLDTDRELGSVQLTAARDISIAAALGQFGASAGARLTQQTAGWAVSASVPEPWAGYYSAVAAASTAWAQSWYIAHQQWVQAQSDAEYLRTQQDVQAFRLASRQVEQAEARFVADVAQAAAGYISGRLAAQLQSTATTTAATQQYLLAVAAADRTYQDLLVQAGIVHDEAVRDAYFQFEHGAADALLALQLEETDLAGFGAMIEAAGYRRRVSEADAYVQFVATITSAAEAHTVATTAAQVARTSQLAQAAVQDRSDEVQLEAAGATAQLLAWQVWDAQVDQATANWLRQQASHQRGWVLSMTGAASRFRQDTTFAELDYRMTVGLAQSQFEISVLDQRTAARERVVNELESKSDSSLLLQLARYQGEVSAADAAYARLQQAALRRKLHDEQNADADWLASLGQAEYAWADSLTAAYQEWVDNFLAASTQYAADARQVVVTFVTGYLQAQAQTDQDTMVAWAGAVEQAAQAQAAYQVSMAAAVGRLVRSMARASADLYIAGESADNLEGKDPASLSPAQRAYLQAVQAAQQQWFADARTAAVQLTTDVGNIWVGLHSQLGNILQSHTQQIGLLEQQAAFGSSAAELRFSTLVTNAARRYVDRITDAFTARDLDEAVAREAWVHDRARAELDYLQQLGQADRQRARRLAQAEVAYFVGINQGGGPAEQARSAWFAGLLDPYVRYRERLAVADAQYRVDTARLEGDFQQQVAALDRRQIAEFAAIRDSHAQAYIDAMAQYQLSVVAEHNRLIEQATQADGVRRQALAAAVAQFDRDVATADKQLWVTLASAANPADAQAWEAHRTALAAARRQATLTAADADHTWTISVSAAETWHQEQLTNALAALEKQFAAADANARIRAAQAQADWYAGLADAQADRAVDATHAQNRWRLDRARAEADWLDSVLFQRWMVWAQLTPSPAPNSYSAYQLNSASLVHQWWAGAASDYVDRVARENQVDLQFTLDVAQAYRTLAGRLSGAYRGRQAAVASSEQLRREAYADSRVLYVQRLVSPALITDRLKADAQQDYQYRLADAQYDLDVGGSADEYRRQVAEAELRRQRAVAAADAYFAGQEAAAAAQLRATQLAADLQERRSNLQADQTWARAVQSALADWDETVTRLGSRHARELQQLQYDYQAGLADSWAAILANAALQQSETPWQQRDRLAAEAAARRLRGWQAAESRRSDFLADRELAWTAAEAAADRQWLEVQGQAADEFEAVQAEQFSTLLETQREAGNRLADAGLHPESAAWAGWLPQMGFWLPGGAYAISPASIFLLLDIESMIGAALAGLRSSGLLMPPISASLPVATFGTSPIVVPPPAAFVPSPSFRSGPYVPPVPASLSQSRPGEYYERMALEAQADPAMYEDPSLAGGPRYAAIFPPGLISGVLSDIGLMLKYPGAALRGFGEGAITSGKVLVNGTATTLRSAVTLGFVNQPWDVIPVNATDLFYGYDRSFNILRVSEELLIGALLGKATSLKVSNWGSLGVHALRYWDMAQNGASIARGAYGLAYGTEDTFDSILEIVFGGAGMLGHAWGAFEAWHAKQVAREVEAANRGSPYRIGVSAILRERDDLVGHVFVILEDRTPVPVPGQPGLYRKNIHRVVRGLNAKEHINDRNPNDVLRFLFGGETAGFTGQIEDEAWILVTYEGTDALLETRWFFVSEKQFLDAMEYVWKMEDLQKAGKLRYHLFNQCAVFARRTLQAAGLDPFYTIPYPPWVYRLLERMPKRPRR
ncbi:MAG: hypothetical protein KatS3mg110_2457 [Pirellulaceae bacterium]|nr:MAG: hypothetical protein KatS3mg110_2457 [Pirellulaceae bacterium]